jgi:hypothetical protein
VNGLEVRGKVDGWQASVDRRGEIEGRQLVDDNAAGIEEAATRLEMDALEVDTLELGDEREIVTKNEVSERLFG